MIDVGLCATDMMYYASGSIGVPGAVFTASHNPAGYNGIKMCMAHAAPIGSGTGLEEIKRMAISGPDPTGSSGTRSSRDILQGYVHHVRSFVDLEALVPPELWGEKLSTSLDGQAEIDFMHFRGAGHTLLARELDELLADPVREGDR